MPKKSKETDQRGRFETKDKTSPKGINKAILLVIVVIAVVVAVLIRNTYKAKQPITQPDAGAQTQTTEEVFDLTTNEGIVKHVDQRMSAVISSDVYTNGNWLARKHYVYTELLALEAESLIKAIHYDTPTRSFSIEHVDGSIRWYPISDKEK